MCEGQSFFYVSYVCNNSKRPVTGEANAGYWTEQRKVPFSRHPLPRVPEKKASEREASPSVLYTLGLHAVQYGLTISLCSITMRSKGLNRSVKFAPRAVALPPGGHVRWVLINGFMAPWALRPVPGAVRPGRHKSRVSLLLRLSTMAV